MSKNDFEKWLELNSPLAIKTIKTYCSAVNTALKNSGVNEKSYENLYAIEDLKELKDYIRLLNSDEKFKLANEKNNRRYSSAINYYLQFKEIKNLIINLTPSVSKAKVIDVDVLLGGKSSSKKHTKDTENSNRKINYQKLNERNEIIGKMGESIVVDYEKNKLKKLGLLELVDKVKQVSIYDDSVGYDIISFDESGQEIHIEVKSTTEDFSSSKFYITENELQVAKKDQNYWIYRVFKVSSKNPEICKFENPFIGNKYKVDYRPVNYLVEIKKLN